MSRIFRPLILAAALTTATIAAAADDQSPSGAPGEDCRAEPRDLSAKSPSGAPAEASGEDAPAPESLTSRLDACDGVLAPPRTGDEEMTEPAPAEGRTPIIRPREIPEQQAPVN